MNPKHLFVSILLFPLVNAAIDPKSALDGHHNSEIDSIYSVLEHSHQILPDAEVFQSAMQSIREKTSLSPEIVSIIDFRKPSTEKRFWVIDIKRGKVLHHTLVAHGKNSGDLYAKEFSNIVDSRQSSLGLFVTGETYIGKHGLSLKLHGLEPGVNDLAEDRAIVIHGADYVSEIFVKRTGRLGRSFGCPAIPFDNHKEIINTLANGACLYIHYTSS
ncbi:MAG TPA: murein L,D-transpeptidase catalytic domain family protein [Cyclobacteriaceae bacterium]|nr:murein L,D-transpeptidase catalytic domain family protein [Cyclobacteriaceae bacterium]